MARHDKVSRSLSLFLAAAVAVVTFAVMAHAAQTLTTPNAAFIPYNLGQNADLPITLPSDRTVLVMGCDLDFAVTADRGVGQATLVRNSVEGFLTWAAFDFRQISIFRDTGGGFSAGDTPGKVGPIFYLDTEGLVFVESTSSNNIAIVNSDTTVPGHKGSLTMIW